MELSRAAVDVKDVEEDGASPHLFHVGFRDFCRGALPLFLALSVLNASNYIFHVAISRLLGPAQYGGLVALLAVVLVISVPFGVLQAAVARKTAALSASGRQAEADALAASALKTLTAIGLGVCLVLFLASPLIAGFLHSGIFSAALLAPYTLLALLTALPLGVLQGRLRFVAMAETVVFGVIVRLGAGIWLAKAGFGVPGAVFATVLSQGGSLALALGFLKLEPGAVRRAAWSIDLIREAVWISLLALGSFRLLAAVDVLLARHFLPATAVGLYSSAWTLAGAMLFLPGAITMVAFPRFSQAAGDGAVLRRWLLLSLGAVCLVLLVALPVLILLRGRAVTLAFGARFSGAAAVLPMLAVANGFQAVINLLTFFHLGAGTRATRLTLAAVALEVVLIAMFHGSPQQIVLVVFAVDGLLLVLLLQAALRVTRWAPPLRSMAPDIDGSESAYLLDDDPVLDLTVVLPCHNAGPALGRTLADLAGTLAEAGAGSYELIVVSDGSTDDTLSIAHGFASRHVRVVEQPRRQGKGEALRVGLARARGRYVAFMDADGDIHPSSLGAFIAIMRLYEPDMILGSKRHPMSEVSYPLLRRVLSWTYHKITRLLFRVNVRDTQTGLKLISRETLAAVLPRMLEKRYAFDLEFLVVARSLGYKRVFEAPVRIEYQFSSQVNARSAAGIIRDTMAIFYRRYILGTYGDAFQPVSPVPRATRRIMSARRPADDAHLRILFLNWRDIRNPEAGGAEVLTHEVARRWVAQGHQVTLLTSRYRGGPRREMVDGMEVRRVGRLRTGSFHLLVQRELRRANGFDLVIDEINSVPFFTPLRLRRLPPVVGLVHQLAREVWDAELPRPLAAVGRRLEPGFLRLYQQVPLVTVSESTREDLASIGVAKVTVVPNGRDPHPDLPGVAKEPAPTFLFVGRLAANKRPDHAVEAFREIRQTLPEARMWIIGRGPAQTQLERALPPGVEVLGHVPREELYRRMARAHCLLVPSVREGWGLVVIEANSVGTPAVGYDVPGIRDSIRHGETGLLAPAGDPAALARQALDLVGDQDRYARMSALAVQWARGFSWEATADGIMAVIRSQLSVAPLGSVHARPLALELEVPAEAAAGSPALAPTPAS